MTRAQLFAALIAATLGTAAFAQNADAQASFSLRAGADVRPLLFTGPVGGTIADQGYLGITVAPGYRLAGILTLELGLTPLIPITGDPATPPFNFLITPGAIVDLYLLYVRGALPIQVTNGGALWLEAGAGISFLMKGYLGLFIDYIPSAETLFMGAEVGFRF